MARSEHEGFVMSESPSLDPKWLMSIATTLASHDPEDLAQETWLAASKNPPTPRGLDARGCGSSRGD